MGKKQKQPKTAYQFPSEKVPRVGAEPTPRDGKTPRSAPPPINHQENPSWRLKVLDLGGPWCWRTMSGDDFDRVLKRLQSLESMTWHEILVVARSENHPIEITGLCKQAQDRLVEIKLDDVDTVISLRVTGRERVFGVRFGSVLRLLWWDPKHEVCPSVKKHT